MAKNFFDLHASAQHGRFCATIPMSSKPLVGFGRIRCPETRRPSFASSAVMSEVRKTIGTPCSNQSASNCAATSMPSSCGIIGSTSRRSGLKLRAVSDARRGSITVHATCFPFRSRSSRALFICLDACSARLCSCNVGISLLRADDLSDKQIQGALFI